MPEGVAVSKTCQAEHDLGDEKVEHAVEAVAAGQAFPKSVSQAFAELHPLKRWQKQNSASEGGQLLVFELKGRNCVCLGD